MKENHKARRTLVREPSFFHQQVRELEGKDAERRRAEEARRESEELLRNLFESVSDGVFALDLYGYFTVVNARLLEMYGASSRKDFMNKNCFDFVAYNDIARAMAQMQKVLEEGRVQQMEFMALRKDGSEFPVEISAAILKDASGNPTGFLGICRDITERKQVEEKLKESRRRFRDLVNLLPQVVWEIDINGNFTFVNQEGFRSHGYTLEEIKEPINAADVFIPEDRERLKENMKQLLSGEDLGGIEYTALRKDGSTFPVLVYSAPIIRGSEVVGVRGVTIDITERKKAEEALRESEGKYRALFESELDGVVVIDDTMRLVLANKASADMFGFDSVEELLKVNLLDYIAPEARKRVLKLRKEALKAGYLPSLNEFRCFKKSGEEIWVSATLAVIQYQGRIAGLASFRDITEEKRIQAELMGHRELIDRILASTPNCVLVIDKRYSVILANREFCRTFNVEVQDVEGKPIDEVICIDGLCKSIQKAFRNRKPQPDLEFRHKINDNEKILATSIIPMPQKEILLILRDITNEHERQEMLYLTDRLASIGEMAAGIAHELNNPLTGVLALSQLLVEGDLPDEIREDVNDIYHESQRAAGIVRNLLAFSRKHESVRRFTQINEVIEDVLRLRAYEQRVNDIKVMTHLDPDLPEIFIDYFQIQQVFLNIILNAESAIMSTDNHGELVISTQRVNGTIKAIFTDDGPGIPKEIMSRIFDPFFTTKEVGQGTGLGLSICYGIVTDHGGRLLAESKPGKGATFIVELPVNAK
jgi:PAS domain S-box-containing protein